ncbi:MAG TPA: hypothetical protein VLG12_07810 [Candidatus Saccharimonadales bacterium]|nr:hypothetical protein [Candidatus Saccharimonadales bacterium]
MKKVFFVSLVFLLTISLSTSSAEAHVLVTDRNIGAVLHIDPEDDPIAGQQSGFFFEFKDTTNKFNPENCDCNFSISENGQTIYSQPLFQNSNKPSLTNASVFYTFQKKDVYQIQVVGKPNTTNAFQAFTLTYDIRVDRTSEQNETTSQNYSPYVWIIILVLLFSSISFVVYKTNKKAKR